MKTSLAKFMIVAFSVTVMSTLVLGILLNSTENRKIEVDTYIESYQLQKK